MAGMPYLILNTLPKVFYTDFLLLARWVAIHGIGALYVVLSYRPCFIIDKTM